MKKIYSLFFFATTISSACFSQKFAALDTNNVKAVVSYNMSLFAEPYRTDYSYYGDINFEIPKGDGISPLFATNTWFTCLDADSNIYSAAETYHTNNGEIDSRWTLGPISSNNESSAATYQRVWKITRKQIEHHNANYFMQNYSMPEVIKNWPAHGITQFGEAENLAPFKDFNHNGFYDPENGDYPLFLGDMAIYSIHNDALFLNSMGIEVHRTLYSYDNDTVSNVIFTNYIIFNRSQQNYQNFRITSWNDYDLGNPHDDYIASVPDKSAILVYNSDSIDENSGLETLGYGANPPAFGTKFLNTTSKSSMSYFHTASITIDGDPNSATDYYNYSNATWLDNSHLVYGGNGMATGVNGTGDPNRPVYHMFPGHPKSDTTWNEYTVENYPGDRRMFMSTEGYSLASKESICIDFAHCYEQYSHELPYKFSSYDALLKKFDEVQEFYNNHDSHCDGLEEEENTITASQYKLCQSGSVSFNAITNETPQEVKWSFPGGVPNFYIGNTPPSIAYNSAGFYSVSATIYFQNGDSLVLNRPKFILVETPKTMSVAGIEITFYDSCSLEGISLMPKNAKNHGNHALFEYSTNRTGVFATSYNGYAFDHFNLKNNDTITLKITTNETCIINQITTVEKIIEFDIPEMVTLHHPSNLLEVITEVANVAYQWYYVKPDGGLIKIVGSTNSTYQALGNARFLVEVDFGGGCILQSEIFEVTTVGIHESTLEYSLSISPNPSNGQNITVHNATASQEMLSITIFNSIGKAVFTTTHQATNRFELNTSNLPSGQYLIHFESEKGRTIKPLIIL